MKILILDDDESRLKKFRILYMNHEVITVNFAYECIKKLKEDGPFYLCSLDHDLYGKTYASSGPGTGYEVAEWLRDNPEFKPSKIIIHSFNEKGAAKMLEVLPEATWIPGAWLGTIDILISK
jgi:CheY-like chemotaxis protein